MFLGHLALGFAGKRVAPKTSLGTLLVASQVADIVWPVLMLAGVEHARVAPGITAATPLDFYDYPISHSLLMDVVWGAMFAGAYYAWRRYGSGAWVLFTLVVSHWVLDWVSHRPDMPLAPGLTGRYGVGLWNSVPLTLVVEGALWVIGLTIYLRATKAKDRMGSYGFWPMVVLLPVIWVANLLGPPPPSARAVAWLALTMVLIYWWGYWVDRHRVARD